MRLIVLLTLLAGASAQGPEMVQVGRVTSVYWPGDAAVATALAEVADRSTQWPGLPTASGPVRLIVARGQARFDSLTAGRVPEWGAAAAFPGTNTIVLKVEGDPRRTLRHELAHLALHQAVRRVPLWFDEGYAALAAGEWDRLDVLQVNLALLGGETPRLDHLSAALRGSLTDADDAYAFATSAILLLDRLGRERGLEPLLTNLAETPDFDRALRRTYGFTLEQFESLWRSDLRGRYGWLVVLSSFALLWGLVLALVGVLWWVRRRRYRRRREALDQGWSVPADEWSTSA